MKQHASLLLLLMMLLAVFGLASFRALSGGALPTETPRPHESSLRALRCVSAYLKTGNAHDLQLGYVHSTNALRHECPLGRYALGTIYRLQNGPRDDQLAVNTNELYTNSVEGLKLLGEHGSAQACRALWDMFAHGYGVAADQDAARGWLLRSAQLEDPEAQYEVGLLYASGKMSGKRDRQQAYSWFSRAASNGHHVASLLVRRMEPMLQPTAMTNAPGYLTPLERVRKKEAGNNRE